MLPSKFSHVVGLARTSQLISRGSLVRSFANTRHSLQPFSSCLVRTRSHNIAKSPAALSSHSVRHRYNDRDFQPIVPENPRARDKTWITDEANLIGNDNREKINILVDKLYADLGVEVAIVTLSQLGFEGYDSDALAKRWGADLFNAWGIGNAQQNNGVLIVLVKRERGIHLLTGDGMRPLITDELAESILHSGSGFLKAHQYGQGLTKIVTELDREIRSLVSASRLSSLWVGPGRQSANIRTVFNENGEVTGYRNSKGEVVLDASSSSASAASSSSSSSSDTEGENKDSELDVWKFSEVPADFGKGKAKWLQGWEKAKDKGEKRSWEELRQAYGPPLMVLGMCAFMFFNLLWDHLQGKDDQELHTVCTRCQADINLYPIPIDYNGQGTIPPSHPVYNYFEARRNQSKDSLPNVDDFSSSSSASPSSSASSSASSSSSYADPVNKIGDGMFEDGKLPASVLDSYLSECGREEKKLGQFSSVRAGWCASCDSIMVQTGLSRVHPYIRCPHCNCHTLLPSTRIISQPTENFDGQQAVDYECKHSTCNYRDTKTSTIPRLPPVRPLPPPPSASSSSPSSSSMGSDDFSSGTSFGGGHTSGGGASVRF